MSNTSVSVTCVGYMPMPAAFKYHDVYLHGRPRHQRYDRFWRKHPPMDHRQRAKIFAPFDALNGFDEAIAETETGSASPRYVP